MIFFLLTKQFSLIYIYCIVALHPLVKSYANFRIFYFEYFCKIHGCVSIYLICLGWFPYISINIFIVISILIFIVIFLHHFRCIILIKVLLLFVVTFLDDIHCELDEMEYHTNWIWISSRVKMLMCVCAHAHIHVLHTCVFMLAIFTSLGY